MFVGHLAVGLAARRAAPGLNLGWLLGAVIALDLVWPVFVLTGLERVRVVPGATAFTPLVFEYYPWSHSLLMAVLWGLGLALLARRRVSARVAMLLALLVVSHWALDVVTHAPDMPLWPGPSPRLGLRLWDSVPLTILVEGTLWIAAVAWYVRTAPAPPRRRRAAFWALVAVTTVLWLSGPWSAPPSSTALAWFALLGWAVVPWAAVSD